MATRTALLSSLTRLPSLQPVVGQRLCGCGLLSSQGQATLSRASVTMTTVPRRFFASSNKLLQNPETDKHSPGGTVDKHDVEKEIHETIQEFKAGSFTKVKDPTQLSHFRKPTGKHQTTTDTEGSEPLPGTYSLPHPIWSAEEVYNIKVTHKEPKGIVDRLAYFSVKSVRAGFDWLSGFNTRLRDERVWLNRICFLETVAGVPGMVAAMVRHLQSLRLMTRDHGWIHTLLEEAENERMHLMIALQLKQPSWMFRTMVVTTQGIFVTFFSVGYLVSPRFCHRFVGYLEEEAVITYTKCLKDIDQGALKHWQTQPAPKVAAVYYNLAAEATMQDVVLAIRADEAHHRIVNHTLASMKKDDFNPYKPGE